MFFPQRSKAAPVIIKVQPHEGLSLGSTSFRGFGFSHPALKEVCGGCRNHGWARVWGQSCCSHQGQGGRG